MFFEVRFKIDYSICNESNEDKFLQEYNGINYHKTLQDYRRRANKMDMYPEDKLIFEMLCDIKKDLLELKNLKKDELLDLDFVTYANCMNYEEIKIDDELEINKNYYIRLVLADRTIACFAKANDEKTFKITKIKRYDEDGLNLFVADIQRHLIYKKKEENGN